MVNAGGIGDVCQEDPALPLLLPDLETDLVTRIEIQDRRRIGEERSELVALGIHVGPSLIFFDPGLSQAYFL
jgi:hypothetical protein